MAAENVGIVDRITELGERASAAAGVELVEIQLRGAGKARLLRVYIDKPGGVTHGDCEQVSEKLSRFLDEDDLIPGEGYTLEVSSPGVERKLSKPRDFERVIGQKVKLTVNPPLENQNRMEGKLLAVNDGVLQLQAPSGQEWQIPLSQVQKANLKFEW